MRHGFLSISACFVLVEAWLPSDRNLFNLSASNAGGKIRGVNLGSTFVIEPWMALNSWSTMGCGDSLAEFDCVAKLGQQKANAAWETHWSQWITEADITAMANYGLNSIRIPLGYWMDESLVTSNETFPQGGFKHLEQICAWASDQGLYIMLDMHGAPGSQRKEKPSPGQWSATDGFYVTYNYNRGYQFLQWITNITHTNTAFRNVGMLEVVNEPIAGFPNLVTEFYTTAYVKIRSIESSLVIAPKDQLHVQFMDKSWSAGDPKQAVGNQTSVVYDGHVYVRWSPEIIPTHASYIASSSSRNVSADGTTPKVIGEWSLSPLIAAENSTDFEVASGKNSEFYTQWFNAQVQSFEKTLGWVFWSWKTEMVGDFRWDYQRGVEAGIIPKFEKSVIMANTTTNSTKKSNSTSVVSSIRLWEVGFALLLQGCLYIYI